LTGLVTFQVVGNREVIAESSFLEDESLPDALPRFVPGLKTMYGKAKDMNGFATRSQIEIHSRRNDSVANRMVSCIQAVENFGRRRDPG
jgi:hypothetical protein